jgi:hypothetical protein
MAGLEVGADTAATAVYLSVLPSMVRGVKQVLKVRMLPTEDQAAALKATLRTCNVAAS